MNTKEKGNIFSRYMKVVQVFFTFAIICLFFFFILGQLVFPDERDTIYMDCQVFESTWQQVLENGERIPAQVPGKVPAEHGEVVELVTTLPQNLYDRQMLCFRTIWQDVDIYIDGELRESYNTKESRPFGKNSAFRYVFVELRASDAGKELSYQFSSNSKYAGLTRISYIGDQTSILLHLVEESGARTIISLFLMLLALFCIVVCLILKYVYKKVLPLNYLAWTIFYASLWMLSEIEFRQIFFKNVSVLTNYTYWSLMLLPIPIVSYINAVQGGRYQKVFFFPCVYSAGMLLVGTLLQVFDIVQFVEQLPFIHIGTISAIICVILTITIDVFKKRVSDYLFVAIGVYGMLFTAVLEMILYYLGASMSLGTILAIGLVFLLVMAIIKTGQDLFNLEQIRQQAITAKDAQAKFLASMSHEIRTPINAVIGMNEMILRESNDDSIQEYAHNIQRASSMLLELVNEVLDFSKVESGKLELVNETYSLSTLLQDEILLLNARAKNKPITVQIDIDSKLPSKLLGDELRIKQVLTNLLSNAVKYTNEGKVTLRAFFQWINDDTINLGFSVTDTGAGIRQEDLSKLFDSFKRLELNKNRNIEGTGLGLNIVKGLVDLMQGNVYVKSEYGKGSTFSIFIPQKVVDKEPIGKFEAIPARPKKKVSKLNGFVTAPNANMLVVDDNSMNLTVIRELLKRTEVKLELAKSGKECLELTKKKKYDIILLDHMMPELDGIETLQQIRSDYSNLNQHSVIFALTANAISGSREMYLEHGFNDYLAKPIEVDKLDELLIQYLPEELVHMRGIVKHKAEPSGEVETDMFYVDRAIGLFYCKHSEELYQQVLSVFAQDGRNYLNKLSSYFEKREWDRYAKISGELRTNAINIGAYNFSKIALKHEIAGKEGNIAYIEAEYRNYVTAVEKLIEKVERE